MLASLLSREHCCPGWAPALPRMLSLEPQELSGQAVRPREVRPHSLVLGLAGCLQPGLRASLSRSSSRLE